MNFFEKILARTEWFRVRNHLRIVEKELCRKNVDHLSAESQQERAKDIAHLHECWKNGLYPKNTDFFDKRAPYFKDVVGTPCAMAYLIEQSGYQDLVSSVTRSNNHVYINDIDDWSVIDWIYNSRLTKEESARVQSQHGLCGDMQPHLIYELLRILPLIVSSVGFILFEWLSYKIFLGFPSITVKENSYFGIFYCHKLSNSLFSHLFDTGINLM